MGWSEGKHPRTSTGEFTGTHTSGAHVTGQFKKYPKREGIKAPGFDTNAHAAHNEQAAAIASVRARYAAQQAAAKRK